ncbi:MAG: efflux RND transporter permease subunit [Pirellulales bacterium]
MPAMVATLCICIVFVPVVFISGAARSLFTPMAMAVVFAMMTSYFLSRTLVPTMSHYLLAAELDFYAAHPAAEASASSESPARKRRGMFLRVHDAFNRAFDGLRHVYGLLLAWVLGHRTIVLAGFALFVVASGGLALVVGRDFFPGVDSGQIRLHVRTPPGTRIENTERYFARQRSRARGDSV